MISELNDIQKELADYMSKLSEDAYCAGWMNGLEFALWRAVTDGPRQYGRLQIGESHIKRLKSLSQACEGWIYFDDKREETFIGFRDWHKKFEEEFAKQHFD